MTQAMTRYEAPEMDKLKRCPRCEKTKPVQEFSKSKGSPDGRYGYCKTCANEKTRQWREANPTAWQDWVSANPEKAAEHRERKAALRSQPGYRRGENLAKYKLTLADYKALENAQGGVCAICRERSDSVLHVDHDHMTGRIRGLLCGVCNKALGLFRDDPARLEAAIQYLNSEAQR